MISKEFIIKNDLGLHSRMASKFVEVTNKFSSEIEIIIEDKVIDGKSIMGILSLGVKKDDRIIILIKGSDEDILMEEMTKILK